MSIAQLYIRRLQRTQAIHLSNAELNVYCIALHFTFNFFFSFVVCIVIHSSNAKPNVNWIAMNSSNAELYVDCIALLSSNAKPNVNCIAMHSSNAEWNVDCSAYIPPMQSWISVAHFYICRMRSWMLIAWLYICRMNALDASLCIWMVSLWPWKKTHSVEFNNM